ncbi:MAG: DUF1351 domain-containing protein [Oscillospiraceae bacterium]|nr:DUF1351 domain-containing protein [Oscillospiraceae bacterium]
MEIQVFTPTQAQPLPPVSWNYDEVKQWVQDGLQAYKGRVYTNDTIAEAKKDRANLNKLAQAIAAKRREMKAIYLNPYEQFDAETKEIEEMITTVSAEIDAQVKAYEEFRKQEKQQFIVEQIYKPLIGNLAELVPYERLHNPKWLNVTANMGDISDDLARTVEKIESGLKAIDQLNLADADITERVKSVFLRNFDLAAAIAEKERIEAEREKLARYQAAQQAQTAEAKPQAISTPVEEVKTTQPQQRPQEEEKVLEVVFRIRVTKSQLDGLGAYMKANGIKPERV